MIVFKVILCGFPPIVSFWEFDKAGALIFGIDLGVFGWKSGWGDFFLWFFLLEREINRQKSKNNQKVKKLTNQPLKF